MRRLAILSAVLLAALAGTTPATAPAAPAPRIVGGATAASGDWSSVAAILSSGDQEPHTAIICGGTLVAPQVVLTAAHCVEGVAPWAIQVVVGVRDLSAIDAADRIKVDEIERDPAYVATTHAHDVALLLLDAPAKPAPMPIVSAAQAAGLAAGTPLAIAGWGSVNPWDITSGAPQSTTYPDGLQTTGVALVDDATCLASDTTHTVGPDMAVLLCAGDIQNGGHDACTRDSGGPLAGQFAGMRTLVGVISFGVGCGQAASPGFYTRLASPAVIGWVLSNPEVTAPTIKRVTNVGRRVTVMWTPPATSWPVERTSVQIDGATATVRGTSASADARGGRITVGVSSECAACGDGGGGATWTGKPTATKRATATVRITGRMRAGRRITAAVATSDPWATVRYQWRVGGRIVRGETTRTLRLLPTDVGRRVEAVVRVRNAAGTRRVIAVAPRWPATR